MKTINNKFIVAFPCACACFRRFVCGRCLRPRSIFIPACVCSYLYEVWAGCMHPPSARRTYCYVKWWQFPFRRRTLLSRTGCAPLSARVIYPTARACRKVSPRGEKNKVEIFKGGSGSAAGSGFLRLRHICETRRNKKKHRSLSGFLFGDERQRIQSMRLQDNAIIR